MPNFQQIEKKWQKAWEEKKIFDVKENPKKKKYFLMEMFPYPSSFGLHMGHAFNYIIGDIRARFKRMNNFNVLYPMGYDSLGLPAENAAIKAKTHPKKYTENSIKNFINQQKKLGLSYDWSRLIKTHDPSYYKWDQWIFLQMLKKGLAYRKKSPVNWCPKCNTVLANEQVHNGNCWRHSDTPVEIKHLEQWYLKITKYAEQLNDFSKVEQWPELIKKLQKNWIGKSHGTEINFTINNKTWPIFTTRPDTIYGVTFMVISAQHPKLMDLVTKEQTKEVKNFIKKLHSVSEEEIDQLEKEGIFTGSYAINPINNQKIPVYAGNFVLAEYGCGMVMAVPAHDQRDFEFAKKYKIPIKVVIEPNYKLNPEKMSRAYAADGNLTNSEQFNNLNNREAIEEITKYLEKNKIGKKTTQYKLRDWLISRQRYWGTPIPIIYCDKCGIQPEENLPVILPEKVSFGKGNPLETNKAFIETKCPKCNSKAKRETDTMDTFVNSSWYYLRYCDPNNNKEIFNKQKAKYWTPVDFYIGGKEHACMHLMYIRFYTKFLRDIKLLNIDEPAIKLFNQGMLHGEDGNKMSKSIGNVIDPLDIINKYSADTLRLFLVSVASPESDFNWSSKGIQTNHKFLNKVFDYFTKVKIGKSSKRAESKIHKAINQVTEDIGNLKYNLAVIKIRILFDNLKSEISKKDLESVIKILSPFCPHLTEELWEKTGNKSFISTESWPKVDFKKINPEFDAEEEYILFAKNDIRNIEKLVKIKELKKVTMAVAEPWKYMVMKKIKKEMEKDYNISRIIKKVMIKEHAQEIPKIVTMFVKNPNKLQVKILSAKKELEILKEKIAPSFEEKGIKVEIKKSSPKAMPGKPSYIFE